MEEGGEEVSLNVLLEVRVDEVAAIEGRQTTAKVKLKGSLWQEEVVGRGDQPFQVVGKNIMKKIMFTRKQIRENKARWSVYKKNGS